MSQIKGKNTKPEIMVRKFLFVNGFRFRIHLNNLPGKPDIALPKYKTVIFINGCFWHGHEGCNYFVVPKTETKWWIDKINRTKDLDVENAKRLQALGWNVITIFECELKKENCKHSLANVVRLIKDGNTYC